MVFQGFKAWLQEHKGWVTKTKLFTFVELKLLPLFRLMGSLYLFNNTILRDTKDVRVVTAKGSSVEIIPFLKIWVNLPMAIGYQVRV
ncbi:ADP/ATP carrier protein, bacterial type [Dillenia turbinata]|uniref:ADP,ATP carrier protein n=1 Tax=Dillenia turbinata TaxID=194707 RepID=A0AAN8ZBZ9_9MAGN